MRRKLTVAGLLALSVVVVVWLFLPPEAKARILAYADIAQTISGAWTFTAPQTFAPTSSVAVPGVASGSGLYFKSDGSVAGLSPIFERFNGVPGTTYGGLILMTRTTTATAGDGSAINLQVFDSGGAPFTTGQMRAVATDVTDGSEDGYLGWWTTAAGTVAERLRLDQTGLMGPAGGALAMPAGATITAPIVSGTAPSNKEIIVDPAGLIGAYTTIQAAIDYVRPLSTVADPWTIRLLPGRYIQSAVINGADLVGVSFVGAGAGSTIIERATALADIVYAVGRSSDPILDLEDSVGCRLFGLTLKHAGTPASGFTPTALAAHGALGLRGHAVTLDSTYVGLLSEHAALATISEANTIEFTNSTFIVTASGAQVSADTFYINKADFRFINCIGVMTQDAVGGADTMRITSNPTRLTIIGGEYIRRLTGTSTSAAGGRVVTDSPTNGQTGRIRAVGARFLLDLTQGDVNAATADWSVVEASAVITGTGDWDYAFEGCLIDYETGAITSARTITGIHVLTPGTAGTLGTIRVVGGAIRDLGGSGGTNRTDIMVVGSNLTGTNRITKAVYVTGGRAASLGYRVGTGTPSQIDGTHGAEEPSINRQGGTATFASAGTVAMTLPIAFPLLATNEITDYSVHVEASANETFWITAKTSTGFTINSSNATSTATVRWTVTR